MTTLTGRATRTLSGYVVTLLEYPRWFIERDVDFTDCRHGGRFDADDSQCTSCEFGTACRWLNTGRDTPGPDTPLAELLVALDTSVVYLRSPHHDHAKHARDCPCDTCEWLREAQSFLRLHRHKA